VKLSLATRLGAWLGAALILLTGLIPGQGFVVCIEQDGCVRIELKSSSADCGGCEGHTQGELPFEVAAAADACPCVDVAVPDASDEQLTQSRSIELEVAAWTAPPPEARIEPSTLRATPGRGPPPRLPRVADSLAHLRSVVLRV
jgi:hypothetical protein